jgi:uncharacterized protein (TIGR03437 family)
MTRARPFYRLYRPFLLAVLTLLCCGTTAFAETWEPVSSGFNTELRIWTSGGNAFAEVRLTFPNTGYRVNDWGAVTRTGSEFSVDATVERWTGGSGQAITILEHTYALGALAPGAYSFTFKSIHVVIKSQQFDPSTAGERWEPVSPTAVTIGISIWTTGGISFTKVGLYFPDTGHRVTDWGQVIFAGNELSVDIQAERWTGESEARVTLTEQTYELGVLTPGTYFLNVKLNGSVAKRQQFSIGTASPAAPRLLTEQDLPRAIALESVTMVRSLSSLGPTRQFSPDAATRVMLFATDIEWQDETPPTITAQAEDSQQATYPLTIEYVGRVPGHSWLTQLIVKVPAELQSAGDIWVSIKVGSINSNRVLISAIQPNY